MKNESVYRYCCFVGVLAYFFCGYLIAKEMIDVSEYYKDSVKHTVKDQNGRRLPIHYVKSVQPGKANVSLRVPRTSGSPAIINRRLSVAASSARAMGAACFRNLPACAVGVTVAAVLAESAIEYDSEKDDFVLKPTAGENGYVIADMPYCSQIRQRDPDNGTRYYPIEYFPCIHSKLGGIGITVPYQDGIHDFYTQQGIGVRGGTVDKVITPEPTFGTFVEVSVPDGTEFLPKFEVGTLTDARVVEELFSDPTLWAENGLMPDIFEDVQIDYEAIPDAEKPELDTDIEDDVQCTEEMSDIFDCEVDEEELHSDEFNMFDYFRDAGGSGWLPRQCPAPKQINLSTFNKSFSLDFEIACYGVEIVNPFVKWAGAFSWLIIVFRGIHK